MMSFDLERTSAWTGLTLIRVSNADIANVAARSENIAFMTLSLIHLLLLLSDSRFAFEGSKRENLQVGVALHVPEARSVTPAESVLLTE
jgi:hypothetical protein